MIISAYYKIHSMLDFVHKDDELEAGIICKMNDIRYNFAEFVILYDEADELPECCTKRKVMQCG